MFVRNFLIAVLGMLALCGLVNALIDPYGFWGVGIFKPTAVMADQPRVYHPLRLASEHFDTVYIGSSRVREGFRPLPGHGDEKFYNAGASGMNAFELGKMMSLMAEHNPPKRVLVGLDFFSFAPGSSYMDGSENGLLGGQNMLWLKFEDLFRLQTLKASLKSFVKNVLGQPAVLPVVFSNYEGARAAARFKAGLEEHGGRVLAAYDPFNQVPDERVLDSFFKGLDDLVARDVHVYLVINPLPASRMKLMSLLGLSGHYDRLFERMHERLAENAAYEAHVELWDFGVCEKAVLERLPKDESGMKWFYDANHFKPVLGDIVQEQVLYQDNRSGNNLQGRLLYPKAAASFARDWDSCSGPDDGLVTDIVREGAQARCLINEAWCRHE